MSGGPGLQRRYRRVLRLLPGYYRDRWEEDMVAAFLDSALTGDPAEDEYILEFGKPTWAETASVAGLAARLYLGGAGTRRRRRGVPIFSISDYLHDPHLIAVSPAELLILVAAVALAAPDAARAQTATPAQPPHPQPG